jgi:outer membrane protein OmpA-like peptidoglycan-associated protein
MSCAVCFLKISAPSVAGIPFVGCPNQSILKRSPSHKQEFQPTRFPRLLIAALVLVSLSLIGLLPDEGRAQEPTSSEEILRSLLPQTKTRGFDPNAGERESKQRDLIGKLQGLNTRQITVEERADVANLVKESEAPSIDIEIFFAFNSAEILPEAVPKLAALGQALSDSKLKGSSFLVAGHTDAKGGDDYNLALSQRRAEAVKQFLIRAYQLDAGHLTAIGFGKEQLKNKENPLADENRRVQQSGPGSRRALMPSRKRLKMNSQKLMLLLISSSTCQQSCPTTRS